MPVCRAYARRLPADEPADPFMRLLCALEFLILHRYRPDFMRPQTFCEKLWRRMLFGRDSRWIEISDKLRMRSYVSANVGGEHLVPMLWSGERAENIPFGDLPSGFVIKANHGSGYNLIVRDKAEVDPAAVCGQLSRWLGTDYGDTFGLGTEWCFRHIRPCIFVEEILESEGAVPWDYKFWCFAGQTECVTVHVDRFERHATRTFDRNFRPYRYGFPLNDPGLRIPRPPRFEEMLRVAESLAAGFDFMRVDLYNVEGRILVGEFAVYPTGGLIRFLPAEFDAELGARWQEDPGARIRGAE